jgi:integration host factor subunit alpha
MGINKKNIVKNIAQNASISIPDANDFLESFLLKIKDHTKFHNIKLSNFGTFSLKKTPKRIGRNPKNLVSYIIMPRKKINFKPSNKIKEKLN